VNTNIPDRRPNFLLYTGNEGKITVEVFLKDETVWLTQKAIGELFIIVQLWLFQTRDVDVRVSQ